MKKFSLIAVIGILIAMLAGCGKSPLVGRWKDRSGGYLEFFSDGTYTMDSYGSGDYSTDGERLRMSDEFGEDETFSYKVRGNELILYYEEVLTRE